MKNRLAKSQVLMFLLCLAAGPAAAIDKPAQQVMIEVKFGPTITRSSDLGFTTHFADGDVKGTYSDVSYETGFSIGGRLGYWFNRYIGAGIDAFTQSIETKDQTVDLTVTAPGRADVKRRASFRSGAGKFSSVVMAPTLFARLPLGIVVPYIGVGPAIFFNKYEEPGASGSGTNVGVSAPIGVKLILLKDGRITLGLFAENDVTYNPFKVTVQGSDAENKLTTLNIMLGASLAFDTPVQ